MKATLWTMGLLLVAALSGCTDGTPDPDDEATGPETVTDPTDYSYVENGTGAHVHDYWGGADEQEVLWYTTQLQQPGRYRERLDLLVLPAR